VGLALLDTSVLIYAAYRRSPLHEAAAALVDRALRDRGVFCIAPQNLVEFAAVATRRRADEAPMPAEDVFRITDKLYRSRTLIKIYPQRGTVSRTLTEGTEIGIRGPAWYDLFLAITMRDAGVRELVTENVSDFEAISFLKVRAFP
jgi:predicted nucleic acid-binding protein